MSESLKQQKMEQMETEMREKMAAWADLEAALE